jgi:hypothetical protein
MVKVNAAVGNQGERILAFLTKVAGLSLHRTIASQVNCWNIPTEFI